MLLQPSTRHRKTFMRCVVWDAKKESCCSEMWMDSKYGVGITLRHTEHCCCRDRTPLQIVVYEGTTMNSYTFAGHILAST